MSTRYPFFAITILLLLVAAWFVLASGLKPAAHKVTDYPGVLPRQSGFEEQPIAGVQLLSPGQVEARIETIPAVSDQVGSGGSMPESRSALAADTNEKELLDSFPRKYADSSVEELMRVRSALEEVRAAERVRIGQERLRAGLYESHIVRSGEKIPMARTRNGRPVSFGYEIIPSDSHAEYRIATIPPEEYPVFQAIELESWWLHGELHRRDACSCGPGR